MKELKFRLRFPGEKCKEKGRQRGLFVVPETNPSIWGFESPFGAAKKADPDGMQAVKDMKTKPCAPGAASQIFNLSNHFDGLCDTECSIMSSSYAKWVFEWFLREKRQTALISSGNSPLQPTI